MALVDGSGTPPARFIHHRSFLRRAGACASFTNRATRNKERAEPSLAMERALAAIEGPQCVGTDTREVNPRIDVDVSIVSHRQRDLANELIRDIDRVCRGTRLRVLLTENVRESELWHLRTEHVPVEVIVNESVKGFASNHNAAFRHTRAPVFCVMNPDIRLVADPFPALIAQLGDPTVGVVAPAVVSSDGAPQDSARRLLTPSRLVKRVGRPGLHYLDAICATQRFQPDWLAGMFMVFDAAVFRNSGGFDERYRLYCEDMDLCCRLRLAGYRVMMDPTVRVIHDARRKSHRDAWHLILHVQSVLRFFCSRVYANSVTRASFPSSD